MPVDTSIYANAVPQQPNPLAMASGVAGLQNAQNQNRLFNQTLAARQAIGKAYQDATDPTTGQLDNNKFAASVAGNPNAAYMAGEATQQNLANQTTQTDLQTKQVALARTHFNNIASGFGSLAAKPDVSYKDFIGLAGDYIAQGMITPQTAATELASLPPNATPQQLQQIAKNYQLRALDGSAQIDKMYGSPQVLNTGGEQRIVAASPMMGTTTPISPTIANTQDPATRGQRIQTMNNGVPGTVPLSSIEDPYGNASGGQPAASGTSPLGTGRYPSQGAPAVPGGPAAAGPAGFVPSGPKLGAEPAANVTATASANQGVALQQTADQVPQRKALLGNLEAALNNFTSGPGADWKKVGNSIANMANPFTDFNAKGIASQEEFAKQATQLAQSQFQALGGTGTDAKLDSAMHTSPNTSLSKLGNQGIINMLKGNEDAIAVKNAEWQDYLAKGNSPQDYGAFSQHFNKLYDPRVFQSVYMSPDQRQDLLKGLDKSEKAQFQQSYNYAVSKGWIPDPRTPQNAAQ